MNRKQRVAVVVGVVVIVLLVLFPPWYDTYVLGPIRLRWVGSDPVVVEEVTQRVAYHHDTTNMDSGPDDETEPVLRYETRVKRVRHEYAISNGLAAGAMLIVLALTIAAVFVLKERKAE